MNHIIPRHADSTAAAQYAPARSIAVVQLHSGFCVDLLAPDLSALTLTDIATSLSRLPRFNGATRGPHIYSVAHHSCFVADLLERGRHNVHIQRAGLLHDAHECLMGDITTPVKIAIGREAVHALEARLQTAICLRFGLSPMLCTHWALHAADQIALQTERRDLLTRSAWPWPEAQHEPAHNIMLEAWIESLSHVNFLRHASRLGLR